MSEVLLHAVLEVVDLIHQVLFEHRLVMYGGPVSWIARPWSPNMGSNLLLGDLVKGPVHRVLRCTLTTLFDQLHVQA